MPSRQQFRAVSASGVDRLGLLGQHDRAEPPAAPRAQRGRRGIERHSLAVFDFVGKARLDLRERDRRGQQDAARRRGAGQFGHREKRLARQRRGRIDRAAAAVGEQERAVPPPRFLAMRSG